MIRRRFIADIARRTRKLLTALKDFLETKDALALKEHSTLVKMVSEREFAFRTDAGKLEAFNDWFRQQTEANLLSGDPTGQFVESAYKRGQLNAYLSSKEGKLLTELGVGDQTREEFLRSSFLAPETLSKIQLLGIRSYEQLKGVSSQMSTDMSRILSQGLADGSGPRQIAAEMQARIASLTRSRANTIARTEVIHAHAEGQLDAFQRLGVKELGIVAEWVTAGDDRVCPDCQAREGETYSVDEARGLIPLHPNCRCTWVPAAGPAAGKTLEIPAAGPAADPFPGPPTAPTAPTAPTGPTRIAGGNSNSVIGQNALTGKLKDEVDDAFKTINSVHGLPTDAMRKLKVEKAMSRAKGGSYSPNTGTLQVNSQLNTKFATAHEFGHYLDHIGVGRGTMATKSQFLATVPKPMQDPFTKLKRALLDTDTVKSIRKIEKDVSFAKYARSEEEIFARAYSQYITQRSADPDMLKFLDKILDDKVPAFPKYMHWPKDEFAEKIAPIFDDLMKAMNQ